MPTVTEIRPQKSKKRVNVYLDGEYSFGIDLDNLVSFGISVNKEFSLQQIQTIIREAEFKKTLDKLLRFATIRPRSEKEVDMWFGRKDVPEGLRNELKEKIAKFGFLDDEVFAKWWVDQRRSFRPRGSKFLKMELQQKGINQEVIKKVLEIEDEDEGTLARRLLDKKNSKWERIPLKDRKQKMIEYLLRQGFEWNIVKEVVDKFLE